MTTEASAPDATRETRSLALLVASMAAGAVALLASLSGQARGWDAAAAVMAAYVVAFVLADRLDVIIEVGDSALSMTLSHVVLAFGLFHIDPVPLVVARTVGGLLSLLLLRDPHNPVKRAFNLSLFALEASVVVVLACTLVGGIPDVASTADWGAVVVSVVGASLASLALIALAIRLSAADAPVVRFDAAVLFLVLAECGNAALGVLLAVVADIDPIGVLVLVPPVFGSYAAYRSYTTWRARHLDLQRLHEFTEAMARCTSLLDAACVTMQQARDALHGRVADFFLAEDAARRRPALWLRLADGGGCTSLEQWPPGDVVLDVASDRCSVLRPEAPGDVVAVPVLASGRWLGVLAVRERVNPITSFGSRDLTLLAAFANHAGTALENVRLIEELRREATEREHQALHDALTGLGNRRLFTIRLAEALARASASRTEVAVLLVDLDGFKDVNDTLGHGVGDALLQIAGSRLSSLLGEATSVARFAGDEFGLLAEGCGEADARALGARVVEVLRAPALVEGLRLAVGASVGVAVFPGHGDDASHLLQHADIALDVAKSRPESPVQSFDASVAEATARRLAIAADLRQAVDELRFDVVYQPLADLTTGRIVSAEALLRWTHPTLGPVSPDEFIPVVERVGLVEPVTRFVLGRAVSQAAAWRDAGVPLHVSVNVSARNLLEEGFPDTLFDLLAYWHVDPTCVTLEITETALMQEAERALAVLDRLHGRGVGLSIDDFGTGYSSLAYLRRLPVTEVKIDRSFVVDLVDNPNDAVIARSIIDLARRLDLTVVAEGIEDVRARDLLVEMGCRRGQGYLLSPPLPPSEVTALLDAQARG